MSPFSSTAALQYDSSTVALADAAQIRKRLERHWISPAENTSETHLRQFESLLSNFLNMNVIQPHPYLQDKEDDKSPYAELSTELSNWLDHYVILNDFSRLPVGTGTVLANYKHIQHFASETKADVSVPNIEDILIMLNNLFDGAGNETFEDGMDTAFSNSLRLIIRYYGIAAIRALEKAVSSDHADVEVVEEVLRQVGRMEDKRTRRHRLDLLELELKSPNPRIRDAASVGIEAMGDPAAIASLQKAINSERSERIRQNLEAVLAQLQDI